MAERKWFNVFQIWSPYEGERAEEIGAVSLAESEADAINAIVDSDARSAKGCKFFAVEQEQPAPADPPELSSRTGWTF